MKRRVFIFIAAVYTVCLCAVLPARAAQPAVEDPVLLVYDTPEDGRILTQLLRAYSVPVHAVSGAQYHAGTARQYTRCVIADEAAAEDALAAQGSVFLIGQACQKAGLGVPVRGRSLLFDDGDRRSAYHFVPSALLLAPGTPGGTSGAAFVGRYGERYPFGTVQGLVTAVPYFSERDASVFALARELQGFLSIPEREDGAVPLYVILDEVGPFSDLDMLLSTAQTLRENAIPFVVRAMPVYENTDYPAFRRYAQALAYSVSQGGAVVLHDPLVNANEDTPNEGQMRAKLQAARNALRQAGVDTVQLQPAPFEVTLETLQALRSNTRDYGSLPVPAAVVFKGFQSREALGGTVEAVNALWLPLQSPFSITPADKDGEAAEALEEPFQYRGKAQATLTGFFSAGNRILTVAVAAGILLSVFLILTGRRVYRLKFHKSGDPPERKEKP